MSKNAGERVRVFFIEGGFNKSPIIVITLIQKWYILFIYQRRKTARR